MNIDTDQWCTASEAARLLGVSTQRVYAMADEGLLEAVRPWPMVRIVKRESVAARISEGSAEPLTVAGARRWVLTHGGGQLPSTLDAEVLRDLVRSYVEKMRPAWPDPRIDRHALDLASKLLDTRTRSYTRKEHA